MWFFPLLSSGGAVGTTVSPSTGNLVLTGKIATVTQTANQIISPAAGRLTLTGKVATVARTANQSVAPLVGHLLLSGKVPVITQSFQLTLTVQQSQRLMAVFRRHGLIDPLVITPTSISDGTFTQTRAWDGTTETDTTTALPGGIPTGDLIDKLARHYGIIDPVQVTATGRTDGTFTQSFSQVGDDITVTPL